MLHIDPESGILSFEGVPDSIALVAAAEHAFAQGVGRVEARVPTGPGGSVVRRTFHRAGFRHEGVRRGEALSVYSLLSTDLTQAEDTFTAVMNSVTPRKRLIAHALVTDTVGRVALCETSFKRDWELPGGIVEPGESPRIGCEREIVEELGISLTLNRVLVIDWLPPHLGWEDATELVFSVAPVTPDVVATVRPDGEEILAIHWLTPQQAENRIAPFAVGRLRAAIKALADGSTRYLEGGNPV